MKLYLFIICFGIYSGLYAQENVKQGLIVAHVESASKTDFKQKIYNYHFLNGHFTGREELMTVVGKQNGKDYVRTDLGENIIYDNRYLITSVGNIIDIKEKKIVWDGRANLIDVRNDSAIYYTNDAFKGKFYSVYNFKTKTYGEVKQLTFKAKLGQDVEFDKTKQPFQIFLYPLGKPKVELVKDAGYGQKIAGDSRVPDPLMWWIDDNNLMYAHFDKENTTLKFVKVTVDTKQSTSIGSVVIVPQNAAASFKKLSKTQGLYQFGTKQILIDIAANTVSDLQFTKPIDGFSAECKAGASGRIIKLNDKEVGKYHFQLKNFKTNGNMVGLVKELTIGTESYQQGIAVWNFTKKGWENVDAEDVLAFIGWIKE
jgi:hypothetical protein